MVTAAQIETDIIDTFTTVAAAKGVDKARGMCGIASVFSLSFGARVNIGGGTAAERVTCCELLDYHMVDYAEMAAGVPGRPVKRPAAAAGGEPETKRAK
jgi:hypothetical protein